ncbi:MAG: ABC transporter ATP-binding protein [Bowdeniella nasicola]|nr:ABC transporter ATP-binding protein [Bowdeniella nasicola]
MKSYQERRVLDDVTIEAGTGRITALLGRNGAGKTTLMEICAGLRLPDSGAVQILGQTRGQGNSDAQLRKRVGVMVQEGGLPMAPRVREVLAHIATLRGDRHQAATMMETLDLTHLGATPVRRLSGGEKQRVAVACALMGRPELLFLDEPTAGVDPHSRITMWELLRRERARGTTIIFTTHLMEEAEQLADDIIVVDCGQVVAAGSVASLTSGTVVTIRDRHIRLSESDILALGVKSWQRTAGNVTLTFPSLTVSDIAQLSDQLRALGCGDCGISVRPRSLETVFFSLTSTQQETQ